MSKDKNRFSRTVNIKNKKAGFEYSVIDVYIAGLELQGTEIKSIREGKASLQESYCHFHGGELFIKGMHISVYSQGTYNNHDPLRERKLLLNKKELVKIESKSKEKGLTIVPKRLFINDRGYAKLEIATAKGKKVHDKRESIKDKDLKREMDRVKI